jgi:hypothetical protein
MVQFAKKGNLIHRETGMPRLMNFADEMPGITLQDLWDDIPPASGNQALGYPTQKPVALLERILAASSNPGDVVLDPFCGCGTTIAAAQQLDRRWIGIDITHLSIALQKYRLGDSYQLVAGRDYAVVGEPVDLGSARQLAADNRYQFQWWALSLIQARPLGGEPGSKQGKKGADQGIDGVITFVDELAKPKRVIVQVKSGKVSARDIRDLAGTMQASAAAIGVFITLEPPSAPMLTAAAAAGHYHSPGWNRDYPALQILTIEELLAGKRVLMPSTSTTFRIAEAIAKPGDNQLTLGLE